MGFRTVRADSTVPPSAAHWLGGAASASRTGAAAASVRARATAVREPLATLRDDANEVRGSRTRGEAAGTAVPTIAAAAHSLCGPLLASSSACISRTRGKHYQTTSCRAPNVVIEKV